METDPHQTEFFVPGDPVPQSRPRVTRRGHVYYAQRIVLYRKAVAMSARAASVPCRNGPLWVGIEFVFTRPKSHVLRSGKLSKQATPFPGSRCGDCTNLAKGVEDSLNGIAYQDDSQVVELSLRKRWCKQDEQPGAYITICEIYPLPQALEKRKNSIARQWTKAETEERDVRRTPDIHTRRMIGWKDALEGLTDDDNDHTIEGGGY